MSINQYGETQMEYTNVLLPEYLASPGGIADLIAEGLKAQRKTAKKTGRRLRMETLKIEIARFDTTSNQLVITCQTEPADD